MKLGIISTMAASSWGGSEELWVSLGMEALAEGHEVVVSIFDWGELPVKIQKLKEKGAAIDVRSRISYTDLKGKIKGKLVQLLNAEKQLHRFVQKENPDVLFVSLGAFCDLEIDSVRNFLQKINKPFYIVVHSNNDTYSIQPSKTDAIRAVCKKAELVFFVSQRLIQQSERQLAYDFKNFQIVNNPVNRNTIGILPYIESETIEMACVGRLQVGVKGQAMLLQMLGTEKWKNRDWKLNIFGHGPDETLIKELILFYGLGDKVFLKGYVSDIRNEIWTNNSILLMPSFIEGMPISLIEAMLCGRTAVVTDVGGNREVLEDGVTGFIADGATPFSFEKAMERAWNKKSDWQKMGELGFEKANSFNNVNSTKTLLTFLKQNKI